MLLYLAKCNSLQIYLLHPQNSAHHCILLPVSEAVLHIHRISVTQCQNALVYSVHNSIIH
ncbi:hypothetical protein Nmel_008672 [Mimus melanotis]